MVSQEEAFSKAILAEQYYKSASSKTGSPLKNVQPKNKKEKCLVPRISILQGSIDPNAIVYWDGSCKNGYGLGLGRIIAISSKEHSEMVLDIPEETSSEITLVLRDYLRKITVRGKLTPTYANMLWEQYTEDPTSGTGGFKFTQRYISNGGQYEIYKEGKYTAIDAVEKGVRYLRFYSDMRLPNVPTQVDFIGDMRDSLNNLTGNSSLRQPVRYLLNNQYYYVLRQYGKDTRVNISNNTWWYKSENAISNAKAALSSLNVSDVQLLEARYDDKLLRTPKAPKGIDSTLYYQINNYYTAEMRTKHQQQVATIQAKQQQTEARIAQQLMLEQAIAERRAAAFSAWSANFMNAQQVQMQSTLNMLKPIAMPEVQPINSNIGNYNLYRVQPINDNMGLIRQIR